MDIEALMAEWAGDWKLGGRSPNTVRTYAYVLRELLERGEPTLGAVKLWISEADSDQLQRFRGRAARAFFRWADEEEVGDFPWWPRIPLVPVRERPQVTVTPEQAESAYHRVKTPRDRALVAVLWCSGMRVSEVCRMTWEAIDLDAGCVLISRTKNKRPRIAPLDARAVKSLRRLARTERGPEVWIGKKGPLTTDGVRQVLARYELPPAHAWRRGWTVHSLRSGISQVSVQAAGWGPGNSGAKVIGQYTAALSSELSIAEFSERWS